MPLTAKMPSIIFVTALFISTQTYANGERGSDAFLELPMPSGTILLAQEKPSDTGLGISPAALAAINKFSFKYLDCRPPKLPANLTHDQFQKFTEGPHQALLDCINNFRLKNASRLEDLILNKLSGTWKFSENNDLFSTSIEFSVPSGCRCESYLDDLFHTYGQSLSDMQQELEWYITSYEKKSLSILK